MPFAIAKTRDWRSPLQTLSTRPETAPRDFLARLVASKAITQFQADWIETIWPNLDDDAFAHPYLQTVREHTPAYLKQAA